MKRIGFGYIALTISAIACVLILAATIRTGKGQETSLQKNSPVIERQKLVEAVRRGGLREAARIKGTYIGKFNPHIWLKYNLEALTKHSAAIVVGAPTENACRLDSSGQLVMTDYRVTIQRVLKGNVQRGDAVLVSLPGGRVFFEDGTSAEIQTPDFEKMTNGKTYILFLKAKKSAEEGFVLTGGPQGLFEISTSESIKPHGSKVDPVVQKYSGAAKEAFLQEIENAVVKWPEYVECCS